MGGLNLEGSKEGEGKENNQGHSKGPRCSVLSQGYNWSLEVDP